MSHSLSIAEIFEEAQRSFSTHKKHLTTLHRLRVSNNQKFETEFLSLVNRILPIYKREASVERLVKFIVNFVISDFGGDNEGQHNFANKMLQHLIPGITSKDKAVRFRSLQLIHGLLSGMQEVDQEVCNAILPKVVERCFDKIPLVRSQSVAVLSAFQDPTSKDDKATQEILNVMESDSSA